MGMMDGGHQNSGMMNGTSPPHQPGSGSSGGSSDGETSGQQANANSSTASESSTGSGSGSGSSSVSGTAYGSSYNSSSNVNGKRQDPKEQSNISWVVCLLSVTGVVGLLLVGVMTAGLVIWSCWYRAKRSPHTARIGQLQSCADETNREYTSTYSVGFKNSGKNEPNEKELESGINHFDEAQLKASNDTPPPAYS